jgi:hypothetical protein
MQPHAPFAAGDEVWMLALEGHSIFLILEAS